MARLTVVGVLLVLAVAVVSANNSLIESNHEQASQSDPTEDRVALLLLQRLMSMSMPKRAPLANNVDLPRKRTCYFNAGMSHNCDYKELVGAVDEANYWSSELTPGRRRRRSITNRRSAHNNQPTY